MKLQSPHDVQRGSIQVIIQDVLYLRWLAV